MKYVVTATRTETYRVTFEVEASNFDEAALKAKEVMDEGDSDFFGEVDEGDEWINSIIEIPGETE